VDALFQQGALNADQQVIGQHTKRCEFNPALQMMKDGSLTEGTFHRTERSLNAAQQDVRAPDLFGAQIVAAAL